jgi:poly-gamma-glutamate capsule biosynthesis protein CapA/YwtB (metallophosphatase superfamily)
MSRSPLALLVACALAAVLATPAAAQVVPPRADSAAAAAPADTARLVRRDPGRDTVRVCAGGDVTLGTNLVQVAEQAAADSAYERRRLRAEARGIVLPPPKPLPPPRLPDPVRLLRPLRPIMRGADVVLLNVEGAIGEGEADSKCSPQSLQCFAFRMPVAAAAAMRGVGDTGAAVVGNVANNHSRDAGLSGLDSTLAHLERAGVHATGADTLATPVVTARGDTVAFLGFATSGPGTPDVRDLDAVRRHVARAAAEYARVVVTMHMGAEGAAAQRTRDSVELYLGASRGNPVAFARAAVEAGADLVIGHGPHVLRAIEWQGRVPVVYSLGNLVTLGPFVNREPLNRGAVVCATLDGDGRARALRLFPTVQRWPGDVTRDPKRRAVVLVDSLSRLDFPRTGARVSRAGVVSRRQPVVRAARDTSRRAMPSAARGAGGDAGGRGRRGGSR